MKLEMEKYECYAVEDFVVDDFFIQWCLTNNKECATYWDRWIKKHPEKSDIIEEGKRLVRSLHWMNKNQLGDVEDEMWTKIEEKTIGKQSNKMRRVSLWLSVASVVLVLFIAKVATSLRAEHTLNEDQAVWNITYNTFKDIQEIILPDGSSVKLEPFSSIKYPKKFNGDRTVFLKGEAFFDISENKSKPFYVIANETITRVVGTSFRVIAFEGEETVEVEVASGTVAVYAQVDTSSSDSLYYQTDIVERIPKPNKKLVVTPNQKVIFQRKSRMLDKSIILLPQVIEQNISPSSSMHFQNASILEVFKTLQKIYGIDFIYNDELLSQCTITTHIDNKGLFEKLDIICAALDLIYEIKNAQIIIQGDGC